MINYCDICNTPSLLQMPRSLVCSICGIEKEVPYDMSDQHCNREWSAIFCQTVYSRKKRFGKLFDSVLMGGSEPKDEKMLRYLDGITEDILSMENLVDKVKQAPLSDKRFGSLHLFARCFVTSFVVPVYRGDYFELRKRVLRDFENLEFAHLNNTPTVPFFNYRWLLKKILNRIGLFQFDSFIKVIKCKHRRQHYEDMFENLSICVTDKVT